MSAKSDAWYRNPWMWLVIALPMSAVVGGIITIFITSANQPDMVVDDYYKKGKAINQELTLFQHAKNLGIQLEVKITDHRIEIISNQKFPALKAEFNHATLAKLDFNTVLTPNASGSLSTSLETKLAGKWQLVVSPMDNSWKLKTQLALPDSEWLAF